MGKNWIMNEEEILHNCKDPQKYKQIIKKNSMVWVRERTIPTKQPPLVGEVIANFCG
jgi:hypothetical protein